MNWFEKILNYELLTLGSMTLRMGSVLVAVLILVAARLIVGGISLMLNRRVVVKGGLDTGRRHALVSLSKYFIYIIAGLLVFESLGVNITVLIAGSTALFVGLGLGLQSTFKDIVGGVILLFERTLEVEDVVEVNGVVGRVKHIGLRTITIRTRDDISIIVPNGNFVAENIINWSHQDMQARFTLSVGVAYGSDVQVVSDILIRCANAHADVSQLNPPKVFLADFGDNALQFKLLFWTEKSFEAEQILSDLRFAIDQSFRVRGITIPYPQRDLHIKGQAAIPGSV